MEFIPLLVLIIFSEMLQLLTHLSEHTGISKDDLLLIYGEHFFEVLKIRIIQNYYKPIQTLWK